MGVTFTVSLFLLIFLFFYWVALSVTAFLSTDLYCPKILYTFAAPNDCHRTTNVDFLAIYGYSQWFECVFVVISFVKIEINK